MTRKSLQTIHHVSSMTDYLFEMYISDGILSSHVPMFIVSF
jgi:hypothetical protein